MKQYIVFTMALGMVMNAALTSSATQWQRTGGPPLGGAVSVAASGNLVFVADNKAVSTDKVKFYRSTDFGDHWAKMALPTNNWYPVSVIYTPSNHTANVGISGAGSWHTMWSDDQGTNWNAPTTPTTNPFTLCLAASPTLSNRVYVGCEAADGVPPVVFVSNDAGKIWSPMNLNKFLSVQDLAVAPNNPDVVLAAVPYGPSGQTGVWKTTDGGLSWHQTLSNLFIVCVAFDPDPQSGVAYAGGIQGVLFKSTDSGETWNPLSFPDGAQVMDLVVDPQNTSRLFAITYDHGIYRSANAGGTWNQINGTGTNRILMTYHGGRTVVLDGGSLYAGFELAVYKSTDLGTTWFEKNQGMYPDRAYFLDIVGSMMMTTQSMSGWPSFGLVSKSTDWGASWVSTCLQNSAIWGVIDTFNPVAINPQNSDQAFAYFGTYDQGAFPDFDPRIDVLYKTTDGGLSWLPKWNEAPCKQSDLTKLVWNPENSDEVWASRKHEMQAANRHIIRTTNGGANWEGISNPELQPYHVLAMAMKPQPPYQEAYAGSWEHGIYRTVNSGSYWEPKGLSPSTPRCIQYDPLNPSTAYVGLRNEGIRATSDDGSTWLARSVGLIHPNVVSLCVHPTEPSILWTATEDLGTWWRHVYLSVDHGLQWIEKSDNLPVHVYDLEIESDMPDTVWATTTPDGIYTYTMPFQFKPLTSASSEASDYNSQRKLVRQEWTSNLHAVYHSGNASEHNVYYVSSTDGGTSWSRKILLGQGKHPAVALDDVGNPQVIWLSDNDQKLLYAYNQGGTWSQAVEIYSVGGDHKIGPPAFSAVPAMIGSHGHVVFHWQGTPLGENVPTAIRYGWLPLDAPGTLLDVVDVD